MNVTQIQDRVMPYNLEIERAVLGACLMGNPDVIDKIQVLLKPEYFYATPHRRIFSAIGTIHQQGNPVDQLSVMEALTTGKEKEDINLRVIIVSAVGEIATDKNAEYHAKFIQQDFQRRAIINSAQGLVERGYDSGTELDELLADAAGISDRASVADLSRGYSVGDAVGLAIDRFEWARQHPGQLSGLPTGIDALDEMTDGLQNTDFIILAARPGEGKTSLAVWIASAMAEVKPGIVFSLEMSARQIGGRIVTANTMIEGFELRTGKFGVSEYERLKKAEEQLANLPITIYDDVYSQSEILALTRMLKRSDGIGWMLIDYLQLIRADRKQGDNREQEVAGISFSLKQLAKELKIPVIALCQLSRAGAARTDRKPQLSDLRESGSLEQDSDVVIFPHRPVVHGKRVKELEDGTKIDLRNYGELIVAKQREGAVGFVEVMADMRSGYWGKWIMENHTIGSSLNVT